MDYLKELNGPQLDAVQCIEGPVMIIAGAGSGKTRVLTYRIAHLIESGVDPFRILSLTFTNKAAREMKERISKVVGETEAKNIWMGTFHSVFSKILRMEADKLNYPRDFTIYDTDDAKSLIKDILKEFNLSDKDYKPNMVYNLISNAKNQLINYLAYKNNREITIENMEARRGKMGDIYEKYAQRCYQSGAMDFDDLLLKTFELFHRYPEVLSKYQQRFQFVMVDEFQDTNFAQYTIIKMLTQHHNNVCVVGDDAQSIYAFRGADIQNILSFQNDYPALKTFKLEQNYRSTQNIVNAANSVIEKNKDRLPKDVWTKNGTGEKIKVAKTSTDNEEGNFVAQSIMEHKMRNQLQNLDYAILYRTNSQSRAIEEALRRLNIPYRIYGGLSFYQRKEIKDLLAYIRLSINHHDEEALKRIINYPTRGIGKTTIDKLVIAASQHNTSIWKILENLDRINIGLSPAVINKIREFMYMIASFNAELYKKPAFEMASQIASMSGVLRDLFVDKTPEGVSRYENIQELLNGIKDFTVNNAENPEGNFLPSFMEEIALITDADKDEDKEDKNRVSLMTIHSSKGLEFPNVYLVGLEEGLFPGMMSMNTREDLEEERRLFYVAITRAMHNLTISFSTSRYRFGSLIHCEPSRFLSDLDQQYLDITMTGANTKSYYSNNVIKSGNKLDGYAIPNHSNLKKISTLAPASNIKAAPVSSFKVGLKVKHSRFGNGNITNIDGVGENKTATIQFEGNGEKKILLKFAKLEIID